jgi:hypothetical protein
MVAHDPIAQALRGSLFAVLLEAGLLACARVFLFFVVPSWLVGEAIVLFGDVREKR